MIHPLLRNRYLCTAHCSQPDLLRSFIARLLYQEQTGYFAGQQLPVGSLPRPVEFQQLDGKAEYLQTLHSLYSSLQMHCYDVCLARICKPWLNIYMAGEQTGWLTPSELFSPHWGDAVAHCIHQEACRDHCPSELCIFEVGAGTGTLARDILNWLQRQAPDLYKSTTYTSIELSPGLAQTQLRKLSSEHRHHFKVHQGNAAEHGAWGPTSQQPCFIIMMEVLDNCAHDKVVKSALEGAWQQVAVAEGPGSQPPREVLQPLSDPLIQRCLGAADWRLPLQPLWRRWLDATVGAPGMCTLFLPTVALQLLDTICGKRPNHTILAADFDELPDVVIEGINAPLVAATIDGVSTDFSSYLHTSGNCDIFFPTDFDALSHLHKAAASAETVLGTRQVKAAHMKTAAFMSTHADLRSTRTRSGFNPLVHDYENTSFYLGKLQATH